MKFIMCIQIWMSMEIGGFSEVWNATVLCVLVSLNELNNSIRIVSKRPTIVLKSLNVLGINFSELGICIDMVD